jgi:DNA-binding Lrp family transcriptional regulator
MSPSSGNWQESEYGGVSGSTAPHFTSKLLNSRSLQVFQVPLSFSRSLPHICVEEKYMCVCGIAWSMTDEPPSPDGPDEYPSDDELPAEAVTVDDIDPFAVDDGDFETLDDFAAAEWTNETTANERIRTVINGTTTPKSAGDIAETALVSETKARETLNRLAEEGIVRGHQTDSGKLYERDPDWHLLKQVKQLAGSKTLVDQIQRVKQEIAGYKDKYDATGPEELLISDKELDQDGLDDVSHWRTAERELSHLRAAYRLKEAKDQASTVTEPGDRQTGNQTTPPGGSQPSLQ